MPTITSPTILPVPGSRLSSAAALRRFAISDSSVLVSVAGLALALVILLGSRRAEAVSTWTEVTWTRHDLKSLYRARERYVGLPSITESYSGIERH
jgi:hypothetical protein